MRVTITKAGRSDTYGIALAVGTTYTVSDEYGKDLISQGYATDTDSVLLYPVNQAYQAGTVIRLAADYTLSSADDQRTFHASTTLTVTVPKGMNPQPSVIIDCPLSGTLSIASNGTLLNGATTTLTRTRANNPIGVAITQHTTPDSYGVSGQ